MKLEFEGIRKDGTGRYVFDDEFDFDSDIIYLCSDTSGMKTVGDLTYYYGFEFNPNSDNKQQAEFRNALKHKMDDDHVFYGEEARRFITDGLYRLDEMKRLTDFGVVISTASEYGERTLPGLMCEIIFDEAPDDAQVYDIQLIKRMCSDVTFDENRAREALSKTERYGNNPNRIESAIRSLKAQFEEAKKNNELFKMKRCKPVAGRYGFIDFLRFGNPYDQETYERLKDGTEVLICDDFITSGSTVKEVIRFLNTINPNTKISVFVLVNQMRDY